MILLKFKQILQIRLLFLFWYFLLQIIRVICNKFNFFLNDFLRIRFDWRVFINLCVLFNISGRFLFSMMLKKMLRNINKIAFSSFTHLKVVLLVGPVKFSLHSFNSKNKKNHSSTSLLSYRERECVWERERTRKLSKVRFLFKLVSSSINLLHCC